MKMPRKQNTTEEMEVRKREVRRKKVKEEVEKKEKNDLEVKMKTWEKIIRKGENN